MQTRAAIDSLYSVFKAIGGEGGITRRCLHWLIHAAKNLLVNWRRGWDSNPRTRLGVTHFPGVRLRPLGHLSINLNLLQPPGGIARGGRRSSSASLRTVAASPQRPKSLPRFCRTHEHGQVLHTFQACAFDRSATSP